MEKRLKSLSGLTVLTLFTTPALSASGHDNVYNHMFGDYGPAGMFMGPIFMIAWIVVLVVLIALILKWMGIIDGRVSTTSTALNVLEDRFARGEIDKKQFNAMRDSLKS